MAEPLSSPTGCEGEGSVSDWGSRKRKWLGKRKKAPGVDESRADRATVEFVWISSIKSINGLSKCDEGLPGSCQSESFCWQRLKELFKSAAMALGFFYCSYFSCWRQLYCLTSSRPTELLGVMSAFGALEPWLLFSWHFFDGGQIIVCLKADSCSVNQIPRRAKTMSEWRTLYLLKARLLLLLSYSVNSVSMWPCYELSPCLHPKFKAGLGSSWPLWPWVQCVWKWNEWMNDCF